MIRSDFIMQLVPGPASSGVSTLNANNNLAFIRFQQRWYLVWRTAPTHFASRDARLEIVAAEELEGPWRHEHTIALGADVREPIFVDNGAELHLFFMELGTHPLRFQPMRTHHVVLTDAGWTQRAPVPVNGFVPWTVRRLRDRWVLLGYRGAEDMYSLKASEPVVEARWSDDLESWNDSEDLHLGGTESDFVELETGQLIGVVRNEGPTRFGSDLMGGAELTDLRFVPDPRKLDSPNLFVWGGEPWLFARRSLANNGNYAVAPRWLPSVLAIRVNQFTWSATKKRSALFRIDPTTLACVHQHDLPSRGDTAFAAVHVLNDDELLVADYSSPLDGPDRSWIWGQRHPTCINLFRVSRTGG